MNDPTQPNQDDPTTRHADASSRRQPLKVWPVYETAGVAPTEGWQIALLALPHSGLTEIRVSDLTNRDYCECIWIRLVARRAGICAATGVEVLAGTDIYQSMCSPDDRFPNTEMILASVIDAVETGS